MASSNTPKKLTIRRYPETSNKSLQAWNAGDEYIISKLEEKEFSPRDKRTVICNDRFGYLTCALSERDPTLIINRKSQERSIEMNLRENGMAVFNDRWLSPLSDLPNPADTGVLQIPKSLDLFRYYLHQISPGLTEEGVLICAFMTKYFTPALLEIAGDYFETTEQSLAVKKSRLLILKNRKPLPETTFLEKIPFSFDNHHQEELKQYPGVFSSGTIDYGTQFLINKLDLNEDEKAILDLGSGNGVLARAIQLKIPDAEIHLMDDSRLAIESSRLNLDAKNTEFHWNDTLDDMNVQSLDLVVSNPPFHFGHETNTEVSVGLFREVAGALKPGGRFLLVANRHLGYQTYLKKFFTSIEIKGQNRKFAIYSATK